MAEVGILGPNDRVELIYGEILHMSPIGNPHNSVVNRINRLFVPAFLKKAIVQIQGPIQIGNLSEPEPDILLCELKENFYSDQKPKAEDSFLIIEVADSTLNYDKNITLNYDKNIKLPLYAEAGFPEFWIVDLNDSQILKHSHPEGNQYKKMEIVMISDSIYCNSFPEIVLNVKEMLG